MTCILVDALFGALETFLAFFSTVVAFSSSLGERGRKTRALERVRSGATNEEPLGSVGLSSPFNRDKNPTKLWLGSVRSAVGELAFDELGAGESAAKLATFTPRVRHLGGHCTLTQVQRLGEMRWTEPLK